MVKSRIIKSSKAPKVSYYCLIDDDGMGGAPRRGRAHLGESSGEISAEIQVCIEAMEINDRITEVPREAIEAARRRSTRCSLGVISDYESLRTLVLGSSSPVKIPTPWDNMEEENTTTKKYSAAVNSCDGLERYIELQHGGFSLGFGKDIISSTYKPVSLYNSSEIGLDNATTCEVFDFSANAWRYVTPSAPYRVAPFAPPVFVDGSLHWFTDCEETKILSFDLHTETFQVISKAPFPANSHDDDNPYGILLCDLDNRLCVSHKTDSNQVIWSFNSSNKTWLKIFSIDVVMTSFFYGCPTSSCPFAPLALLDAENKKKDLLFYDREQNLVGVVVDRLNVILPIINEDERIPPSQSHEFGPGIAELGWSERLGSNQSVFILLVVASLLASFSRVMKASILKVMSEESWVWRPDNGKTRSSMDISEENRWKQGRKDPPQKQRGGLSSQKKKKSSCKGCYSKVFEESELDGNGRKNPSREQANIVTGLEKSKETVDHENVETNIEDDVKVVRVEDDFEESPPYKPGHQRYLSGQVRYIFCIPREHLQ
ncbi:LOW QUALITY PROTEIN: hypothetical protein Bca101_079849 [Brassica carinata]